MRTRRAPAAHATGAEFSPRTLRTSLVALQPGYARASLCVAFSGGPDSTALLAALASLRAVRGRLRAVHVDHGLHPDSGAWARHCIRVARQLGVPIETHAVRVSRGGRSPEAAAREARYALLGQRLRAGELLLTAHHADDQLETVLLQLLRGAGLPGIAAMPAAAAFAGGRLLRPLLGVRRAELVRYVRRRGLACIEDPSNGADAADRNYLRHAVLPPLLERFPGAVRTAARSARHAAEAQRLLAQLAQADAVRAADGAGLQVAVLRALSPERRRNLLRWWIAAGGHAPPDSRRLEELATRVLAARADAHPEVTWGDSVVQRQGGSLRLGHRMQAPRFEPREWRWRSGGLPLPPGGRLTLQRGAHGPIDLGLLPAILQVRPRSGGERLRPAAGRPSRTLKSLLQGAGITPGERARLPLVFAGGRLVAAGDLWVDVHWHAGPRSRARGRLVWRRG